MCFWAVFFFYYCICPGLLLRLSRFSELQDSYLLQSKTGNLEEQMHEPFVQLLGDLRGRSRGRSPDDQGDPSFGHSASGPTSESMSPEPWSATLS